MQRGLKVGRTTRSMVLKGSTEPTEAWLGTVLTTLAKSLLCRSRHLEDYVVTLNELRSGGEEVENEQ